MRFFQDDWAIYPGRVSATLTDPITGQTDPILERQVNEERVESIVLMIGIKKAIPIEEHGKTD
jgi:hypothetical protein